MDHLALKWNNHRPAFFHHLKGLREKGWQADVTIACGFKLYKAHRLVLSACSEFFTEVFNFSDSSKMVVVLKDIKADEMEALLDYMYLGEVEVPRAHLNALIKAAEALQIKGLAVPDTTTSTPTTTTATATTTVAATTATSATTTTATVSADNEDEQEEEEEEEEEAAEEQEEEDGRRRRRGRGLGGGADRKRQRTNTQTHTLDNKTATRLNAFEHESDVEVKIESIDLADDLLTPSSPPFDPKYYRHDALENSQPDPTFFAAENKQDWIASMEGMANSSPGFLGMPLIGQEENQLNVNKPSSTLTTLSADAGIPTQALVSPSKRGYGCPNCDKTFTDRYKRDRHRLIHTGEKPFKCPCCDYRSSRKDPVIRHIKFKHSNALDAILN